MDRKFYITTTLPYVNAEPHIGFAMEIVQADIIARYRRELGDDVFFNTGTDEHGLKIYRKALETGKDPQAYADEYAEKFRKLKDALNLSDDLHFIRTTDPHHKQAAQEFWKLCEKNSDIYKATYKTKYCVGCELEKTDSELVDGKCPIHQNLELEIIEEENYFFRFSKYQKPLLELYEKNQEFVLPKSRLNEIKKFVEAGLTNFSISRLKEKMPWGMPVPGDEKHVMYVWFDALVNYISTLGWPENTKNFEKFWGTNDAPNGIQMAGKDQIRQQAAMWQAMLMSAKLPNSKQILIHGFVTSGGQKMSKSLGNVIDPYEVVGKYGTDAFRYYVARELNMFDDSDFTWEKFNERYNADLANGIGNLAARVTKLAEDNLSEPVSPFLETHLVSPLERFEIGKAIDHVFMKVQNLDKKINDEEPFKLVKVEPERGKLMINELVRELYHIAETLAPFLPDTSEKIKKAIKENKKPENLFPRK